MSWRSQLDVDTRTDMAGGELLRRPVPGLTVAWHPDTRRVGERAALLRVAAGRPVELSRLEPLFQSHDGARPLADPHLSRRPIRIEPGADGGLRLVCSATSTAVVADGEPVAGERAVSAAELERGVVLLLARRVALLLHRVSPIEDDVPNFGLVGESRGIVEVRRQVQRVAELDVPVLLRGETGTGKELIARAIHGASVRRERPYLAVNMGAVPPTLAAAELFGAAKGAFTGAEHRREGYISRADGGTLFLDEIGEVPLDVQSLLLRFLENGEVQSVGGGEPRVVDVRTIAASDTDLVAASTEGNFRAPLLYRLGGYEIRVPTLGERREDVGRLLLHFLRHQLEAVDAASRLDDPGPDGVPWLPAPLVARLVAYRWPGNVRQLKNVARHLVVDYRDVPVVHPGGWLVDLLAAGGTVSAGTALLETPPPPSSRAPRGAYRSPREVGDDELVAALRRHRYRPGPTARELGVSRSALYLLIDACHRTRKASDLSREEIEAAWDRANGRLSVMADELEVSEEALKRRMNELGIKRSKGPSKG